MKFPVRIYALLAVSACCFGASPLVAQIPEQGQQAPASPDQPAAGQLPPSPVDEQEQLIRQVDPLDREEDKKKREKADREARKKAEQNNIPIPGSIAESEQNAARRSGPEVEDDENSAPVQEYTGPAVLSRSYSISQSLVPEQIKWNETFGLSSIYDSGIARNVNPDGSFGPVTALNGAMATWKISGRHYFHHDVVSFDYFGNYSKYIGNSIGAYNGSNQSATGSYTHMLTHRMKLNLSGSGSILAQNSVLENQPVGPQTIANISVASSPNIQIFDNGAKQMTLQADLTWQESARLSFNLGTSYFGIEQDSPLLLGVTGQQARGDVNYRLTSRTTIGAYYSFSHYLYPSGFGNTDTDTFGGIFSYAFNRSTQLRLPGRPFGCAEPRTGYSVDSARDRGTAWREHRRHRFVRDFPDDRHVGAVRQGFPGRQNGIARLRPRDIPGQRSVSNVAAGIDQRHSDRDGAEILFADSGRRA